MSKYRSNLDWKTQYNSNKQGYSNPLELYPFLRKETTAGVVNVPQCGTQGNSVSGASPITDLSAETENKFNINVDGTGILAIEISNALLTSSALIVAELEVKINTALATANYDVRVWVEFAGGVYKIASQTTGTLSSVVITSAATDDVAALLKLGTANAGVETAGTDSDDWIYITKAGVNFSQEYAETAHRSGRQASSIYKKKKMAEGSMEMYVLLGEAGGNIYMPNGLKTILLSAFGNQSVNANNTAVFDMKQPHSTTFSLLTANNVFGQITNGCYIKTFSLECAGDDAAKISMDIKARDSKVSIPAKIITASSNASIAVVIGQEQNFEVGSRVMIVDADGRTVTAGAGGELAVTGVNTTSHLVALNASVVAVVDGYLVPYYPIFGYNIPADNAQISTDLSGSVSFDNGATVVDTVTSFSVKIDPQLTDLDNYYGEDGNRGFVDGSKTAITVSVVMHLTAEQGNLILKAKRFFEFGMKMIVGFLDNQKMVIECPRVVFKVPSVEIPENGAVEVTLEGSALQTRAGALDAIKCTYINA
jgi:hypothetical protein